MGFIGELIDLTTHFTIHLAKCPRGKNFFFSFLGDLKTILELIWDFKRLDRDLIIENLI